MSVRRQRVEEVQLVGELDGTSILHRVRIIGQAVSTLLLTAGVGYRWGSLEGSLAPAIWWARPSEMSQQAGRLALRPAWRVRSK